MNLSTKSAFIISLLTWVIFCTIYDVFDHRIKGDYTIEISFSEIIQQIFLNFSERKSPALVAFSALSNAKALFSCEPSRSQDVITCFHGIRSISAYYIIFGHVNNFLGDIILNSAEYGRVFVFHYLFSLDTFF